MNTNNTMQKLMEEMMNKVGGYVADKVESIEQMTNDISNKEAEIEETNNKIQDIINQLQLIEIMKMQLEAEQKILEENQKQMVLDLAEMKRAYDADKLGKMIMNIANGNNPSSENVENNE